MNPSPGRLICYNTEEQPSYNSLCFLGITHETYWIPKNFLGQIGGGTFPNWLRIETMWTFIIAFSLVLFNLLPTTIFDGGRMIKEVIEKKIGQDWDENAHKRVHFLYDEKFEEQHLQTQNIKNINHVWKITEKEEDNTSIKSKLADIDTYFNKQEIEFLPLDTSNDGAFDSINIQNSSESAQVQNDDIILVDIEFAKDRLEEKKTKIYKIFSWSTGLMVLFSFLLSIVKFGNSLFWI